MTGIDAVKKQFLQVMCTMRSINTNDAMKLHKSLCVINNCSSDDFDGFMESIKGRIEDFHLAIRQVIEERESGDILTYVIINTLNNEATKNCSPFSQLELELIKKIIASLVDSSKGWIGETTAINLAQQLKKRLSPSEAEDLIEDLIQDKWLLRHKGHLSMGSLMASELQGYLESHFPDILSECYFCKRYTFMGYKCSSCSTAGHKSCYSAFWERLKKVPQCANRECNEKWEAITLPETRKKQRI